MEFLEKAYPFLAPAGMVAAMLAVWQVLSWRNARRAAELLKKRLWEQGWDVRKVEHRIFRRGPYLFAANRGVVFRLRAVDESGAVFNGFASVSVDWDDYKTERIEILWDAEHLNQDHQLRKPEGTGANGN